MTDYCKVSRSGRILSSDATSLTAALDKVLCEEGIQSPRSWYLADKLKAAALGSLGIEQHGYLCSCGSCSRQRDEPASVESFEEEDE